MKNSKILKTLIVISILLCAVVVMFACTPADIGGGDSIGGNDTDNNGDGGNTPTAPTITITFMDGDEVIKESTIPEDALDYVPEKEGFVFVGWYLDEDLTEENEDKPTEDVNLYAKWEVATFTVRFLDGEGQPILVDGKPSQKVAYGESAIAPDAPDMPGYDFIGWNMEFNSVKSDLTIRALYDTEKMTIYLYSEGGDVIKSEEVTVGANISLYYNTMLEYASSALPGGLSLVGLYTDAELNNEYKIPSGEHVMPSYDIHLYSKAMLQDIEGLALNVERNSVTMDNNTYSYDTKGFEIARILQADNADSVITYAYEWYDVNGDVESVIAGQNSTILNVPARDVGTYTFKVKVTASYKDLTPVSDYETVSVTITKGTLNGLVSVEGFEGEYNGLERKPVLTGTLASDTISYKLENDALYSSVSPVKNAGFYKVMSRVERKNYEPIELSAVEITINTKLLTPKIYMNIRSNGVLQSGFPYYELEHGAQAPSVICEFEGFVNGENESVFDNEYAQSNPYYAGAQVLPDGEYYIPTVNLDNCYVVGSEKPKNYHFGEIVPINPDLTALKIKVLKRALTITLKDVSLTYGDDAPASIDMEIENALDGDVNMIRDGVNSVINCDYAKGSPVKSEGYVISADYINDSYAVSVRSATLMVNKANLTVTPKNYNVIYGDAVPTYDYEVKGLVNGENKSVLGNAVYVCNYQKGSDVVVGGGYAIDFNKSDSFKAQGSKNYNITFASGQVVVAPKNVAVTLDETAITYGDDAPADDVFYGLLSAEGLIEGHTIDNICAPNTGFAFNKTSYSPGFSVKEEGYNIGVVFTASTNYVVNANKGINGTMMVQKKALTISVVQSEVVYGEDISLEVKYDGLIGTDAINPEKVVSGVELVGGYEVGNGVGEYTVSVGNGVSNNYEISYVDGKVIVIARKLTIKARDYTDDEVVWYGSLEATDGSVAYAGEGLYAEDVISGIIKTTASTQGAYVASGATLGEKFAWENAISIERAGESTLSNYVITYDFQVAIATYGVFVNANQVVYDGLSHGLDVEHIFEDPIATVLFSKDGQSYDETAITYSQAGNYDVYYSIRVYDANGEVEKEIKEKLTVVITPRTITFTADAQTIIYGEEVPELTYTTTAYEEGKDAYAQGESLATLGEISVEAVDFSLSVGIYDIVISGLENANYDVKINNSKFTIKPAPLTITASSHSITYGDAVPAFSASCEGFVYGESLESIGATYAVSSDYEAVANRKSGEFAIVPSVTLLNYEVTAVNGKLSVAKMDITLTAENKTVVYGDATPTLTAKANKLGYNDKASDLTTIGNIVLSTSYVSRNNVGSYAISISAVSSEKYNITCIAGSVKVNPYETAVVWTGIEARTYDGNDYTSVIGATYKDLDGVEHNASVALLSRNANSTSPNAFKNASTYDATATTTDANYKLTSATKAVVMNKATYEDVTHDAFSGVYSSKNTLGDSYALNTNYRWANASVVPTVDKISYPAYYNADSENYNDFALSVSLELIPASVTFATLNGMTGSIEGGYEIIASINTSATTTDQKYTLAPVIYCANDDENIGTAMYSIGYSNGNTFIGGTYLTVATFSSVNYKIDSALTTQSGLNNVTAVNFFIKYRSVDVGGTLYTPEEAINVASSGNIIVKSNTNFASQQEVITKYYNSDSYYTIKSNVSFVVPYSNSDTQGYLPAGDSGGNATSKANYNAHPEKNESITPALYLVLSVPSNVTITVNGSGARFAVGALTGSRNAGTHQNKVTGNYSEVHLSGKIVVTNSAKLEAYGYVKGSGEISTNGTATIKENMYLEGWPGGSVAGGMYLSNKKNIGGLSLVLGGTISESNPSTFPFKQYQLRSIEARLVLNYGASLFGYAKIATSEQGSGLVSARVTEADMAIVSSSTSDAEGILHLTAGASIVKTVIGGRVKLETNGAVNDGYLTLNIGIGNAKVNMTSEKVYFPV
ncbi:MAG: InlB B-repeat-containing protein, partial [Clostridia bacterium]|nr:InlB B-repeat-containing protein [Clostridia bacterium]